MNRKGFTLVELLAVIVVLAVLMTIATPNVLKLLNGSKKNTTEIVLNNLRDATTAYAKEQVYLKKLSLSACNFEINSEDVAKANINKGGCVKAYDISFLKNSDIFDDKDNSCDNSRQVYVYKYFNQSYTDIKVYVPNDVCEVK